MADRMNGNARGEAGEKADDALLALIAKGDSAAWEALIVRYKNFAYSIAMQITRNADEADDAFQEAFIRIRAKAGNYTFGIDAKNWVAKIAYRETLRVMNKRKRDSRSHVPLDAVSDEISLASKEAPEGNDEGRNILKKSLGDLPEALRTTVVLHFAAGMTQVEIAEEMNCTQSLVSGRLKQALESLRKSLAASGITDAYALTPAALMTSLVSEEAPKMALAKVLKLGIVKLSSIKMTAVPLMAKKAAVASILSAKAAIVAAVATVAIGGTAIVITKEQPKPVPQPVITEPAPVQQPVKTIPEPVITAPKPVETATAYPENNWVSFKENGKFGFKDENGRVVIPAKFDLLTSFSEGLAPVEVGTKWGYIDKTGTFVIEPKFFFAAPFEKGQASVQLARDGKPAYIDKTGKLVEKNAAIKQLQGDLKEKQK